jgi:integrase
VARLLYGAVGCFLGLFGPVTSTKHGQLFTASTLLLEAGVPMKVVQERLGHSTMMLTADTYSHVSASLQERAVEELSRYVEQVGN